MQVEWIKQFMIELELELERLEIYGLMLPLTPGNDITRSMKMDDRINN